MVDLSKMMSSIMQKTGGGRRRRHSRRHRGGAAPTGAIAMPASIKDMMTNMPTMPTMKGGNNALSPGVYSSGPAAVGGGRSRRLRLRSTRTRRRRSRSHRAGGGRTKRRR